MAGPPPELARLTTDASAWSFEEEDQGSPVGGNPPDSKGLGGRCTSSVLVYESLDALRLAQSHLVEEAVDCTGIAADDACLMLRQHGWDVTEFNEAFFENPEGERRLAGVPDGDSLRKDETGHGLCAICFCDTGVAVLPCEGGLLKPASGPKATRDGRRHPSYCEQCWQQYLKHAVEDGKRCLDVRCPTPGCGEAVRPGHFAKLLGKGPILERYDRFLAESLVDDSRGMRRWCPGQRCGRAAENPSAGACEVTCPCGEVWCFGCGTDAHLPVSCDIVRQWEKKNRDEGGDATWILVNTKLCPKCQNPIEKNGGCMHMTCRKPGGCGHEFCWICMKDWQKHVVCNATPQLEDKADKAVKTRLEIMRYAHAYERYVAHHKAQQFAATDQLQCIQAVADLLCACHGLKVTDVDFLVAAIREIARSRRFLKWTYAYGFFSNINDSQRKLYEFHQAQLEGTLERLSDLTENTSWDGLAGPDAASLRPFYDLRAQLIGLTGVVREFFSHLLDAIERGTLFSDAA